MDTQKKLYLLPHGFQIVGAGIAIISLFVFLYGVLFLDKPSDQIETAIYSYLFIFLGIFLMGLSREKQEDEFTIYLRTRSALTAIAIMFGLRILFAIVFALFSISHSEQLNDGIWKDLWKSSEGLNNYGGAFLLYFIIYKIRLARYNICLKRDNQLAGYEE